MSVRIDKWLWSARFFKTRSLAKKQVETGKIKISGQKVKPSRHINVGDLLQIRKAEFTWDVEVLKLIDKRVSAKLAVLTYLESAESIKAREDIITESKMTYSSAPRPPKHPDKKSRRELIKVKKGGF
ncbi:MAG: RNA-binding S4 domain-containing protein [Marinicellaceae bacterium]